VSQPPEPDATIILVDADGLVTDDADRAVRGEIVEELPDGTIRSTLFTTTPPPHPAPTPRRNRSHR